jgi:hypothetical protein
VEQFLFDGTHERLYFRHPFTQCVCVRARDRLVGKTRMGNSSNAHRGGQKAFALAQLCYLALSFRDKHLQPLEQLLLQQLRFSSLASAAAATTAAIPCCSSSSSAAACTPPLLHPSCRTFHHHHR